MILTRGEKIGYWINAFALIVLAIVTFFPLYYILIVSLTPADVLRQYGGFQIIPNQLSLEAYELILGTALIPRAFLNSVIITLLGTFISMFLTVLMAYPLSRKQLPGRNIFLLIVVFPMLFSGGLVPLFILVKSLNLINSFWAVVLPGAIGSFNLLIMKGFIENLPEELMEAARLDGATEFQILLQIVLPLSTPVLATLTLFYAVGYWNAFFGPMMFLNKQDMQPLTVILRDVLMDAIRPNPDAPIDQVRMLPGQAMKMAAVVVSIVPIALVYPWLQRYFTKGVLLGSIKG